MKSKFILLLITSLLFVTSFPQKSFSGVYGDNLAKCLINSTSKTDRILLVRWIFTSGSQHPALKDMFLVSEKDLDKIYQDTADLFIKLLTESCKEEANLAFHYEGQTAFNESFSALGRNSAMEIVQDQEVVSSIGKFAKYMDTKRLAPIYKPLKK